ncbi:hypothetical protein Rsub_09283 [Raphidocelis subcapitata]|uniref:Uncharacterized protein n=1 Tax=Raphidocelis subcapitata TaxID=307507 RepID=A0A2V0PFH9_9CHLO|nr:hypothetical protein Rsub_09283 [Raphidocelis subcapitata]|eukprot:GBF96650.1 hypothetical protein Rsub_09283 [Raphidocelis subcapitata]
MALEELCAHLQQRQGQPLHLSQLPALRAAGAHLLRPPEPGAPAPAPASADAPIAPELAGAIELLAAALLSPPEGVFADLGGAPRRPEGDLASYWEATALRLRLLAALLPRLGPLPLDTGGSGAGGERRQGEQQQQQQQRPGRADEYARQPRHRPVVGIVEVVDEEGGGNEGTGGGAGSGGAAALAALKRRQRRAELASAVFAAAALHADSRGSHSSGGGGGGDAQEGGEDGDCEGIAVSPALLRLIRETNRASLRLETPWADNGAARLSWQLLGALLRQAGGGAASEARAFAAAVREWLLPRLREPLFAPHRHTQAQDRGSAEPYRGPGPFQRALAARQLAWAAQRLAPPELDAPLAAALLPAVLAASDDASACVARLGAAALHHLASSAPAAALRFQRELLLGRAAKLVVGCEAGSWETSLPAAVAVVRAIEPPGEPRAEGYHRLTRELLSEAERAAHKPRQRLVFMACLGLLLPRLRLYAARHLGRLAPLLLEWLLSLDGRSRLAALGCWGALLRACWPRAGAHGQVVWRHLLAAARGADVDLPTFGVGAGERDGGGDSSGSDGGVQREEEEGADDEPAAFAEVGRLLLAICGRDALAAASPGKDAPGDEAGGGCGVADTAPAASPAGPCEAALLALLAPLEAEK